MIQLPPEETRFKKNVLTMANAIHFGFLKLSENGYKVMDITKIELFIALLQSKELDEHFLITNFIEKSHKVWDKIKERDEIYFCNNASSIFDFLPADKVNIFKDLFLTVDQQGVQVIGQTLKDQIWGLLDNMIKVSIKYLHKKRITNLNFLSDININHHILIWQVVLN